MAVAAHAPGDVAERLWDVVVVGTGMGGATAGQALARAGRSVLFLEKGLAPARDHLATSSEEPGERLRQGAWPTRIRGEVDGVATDLFAPLGCGAGGSTLTFGAALERFERADFEDVPGRPHPTGGWPVGYDEFAPWYERAEALFRVRGTRDPLGEPAGPALLRPPPASEQDQLLLRDLAAAGLHPYRLHVGIAYLPGCRECVGFVCPRRCKSDAATICLEPAVERHGAALLTGCEVERLVAEGGGVERVEFRHAGGTAAVRGRVVVLAGGTYHSAVLMLRSGGLGDAHGLVGRNLMFHSSDWFALWPRRRGSTAGPRKAIGLRDLYAADGVRLGSIQSTGLAAGYGNVLQFLYRWFDRSRWRRLRPLRPLLRIPAKIAERVFGQATIFAMIIEDFADPTNRLLPDPERPGGALYRYRTSADLKARTALARRLVKRRLAGWRTFWLLPELMLDLGHPTGTCRFGDDPATSVLDRDCRVHDLANLYVVDGSFMPSSGGTNPSLTIAANALRVADRIDAALGGGSAPPEPVEQAPLP